MSSLGGRALCLRLKRGVRRLQPLDKVKNVSGEKGRANPNNPFAGDFARGAG